MRDLGFVTPAGATDAGALVVVSPRVGVLLGAREPGDSLRWKLLYDDIGSKAALKVTVDPNDGRTLYVHTRSAGIYRRSVDVD